jgi:hypothetical protein
MADQPDWHTNPEHAHVIGLDNQLAEALRTAFGIADIAVECGVEGTRPPYTYHFTISNVPPDMHGHAASRATDLLSSWTGYRFEVHCL